MLNDADGHQGGSNAGDAARENRLGPAISNYRARAHPNRAFRRSGAGTLSYVIGPAPDEFVAGAPGQL